MGRVTPFPRKGDNFVTVPPRTAAADLEWAAGPDGKTRLLTDEELASIGMTSRRDGTQIPSERNDRVTPGYSSEPKGPLGKFLVGEAHAAVPATSEFMDATAGETAPTPVRDFAPVAETAPRLWKKAFGDEPEQDGRGVVAALACIIAVLGLGCLAYGLAEMGWIRW